MKRLKILVFVACVGLFFAPTTVIGEGPPGGIDVNVSTVYQFAGYAGPTTGGNTEGIVGMHALCQAEFGYLSRMCTSKEFWTSPGAVAPTDDNEAWIQPSIVGTFIDGDYIFLLDFSGARLPITNPGAPTCHSWTSTDDSRDGTILQTDDAGIFYRKCDTQHLVTCCTPAKK